MWSDLLNILVTAKGWAGRGGRCQGLSLGTPPPPERSTRATTKFKSGANCEVQLQTPTVCYNCSEPSTRVVKQWILSCR